MPLISPRTFAMSTGCLYGEPPSAAARTATSAGALRDKAASSSNTGLQGPQLGLQKFNTVVRPAMDGVNGAAFGGALTTKSHLIVRLLEAFKRSRMRRSALGRQSRSAGPSGPSWARP